MTRWQHIESVFHALADRAPGPARDALLTELCGGDAGLAAEVTALLDEDRRLREDEAPADPHVGLRLGSYQIERLVARGGMAAVYEARRADEAFRQRVAIKIMDLRLSDPALVAQFRAERQILAALEHPALTRLLDGGVTALGAPYLVMEYVDGEPIDRYCDTRRLDVPARLRLFAQVCDGVAFAHRNLVLHRDLKPSNILVSADGRAKVVDFGTATLLQPDRDSTISRAPLTPAYASPEQLTGRAVGTASDQYSLGLVLYELVAGAAPFPHDTSLMASVERALAGTPPTAPHTTVTPEAAAARQVSVARLRRQLSGDLGTIVRKALHADPRERYPSVQHLADDLTRWARGEPILGRPPSLAYAASRFVRRHWVAVALVATLLAGLVGATLVSVAQAREARAQEARAQSEAAKARQLNRFLTQMLSSANPTWYNAAGANAGSITVKQVLDGASQLIAGELGGAPDVEAEMRRTLGRTYIGLGVPGDALPHLERALALYRDHGDRFGAAFSTMLLGEAGVLRGEYREAETLFREALAYVRSQGDAADPELHLITASDLGLAIEYQRPGDAEAVPLFREAIAVGDRSGFNPAGTSVVVSNLGVALTRAGRLEEAEAAFRDARSRMERLPTPPPELYLAGNNLSNILRIQGAHAEAERLAAEAIANATGVWPPDHPYQAAMRVTLGRARLALGRPEPAREAFDAAYDILQRIRPAGHTDLAGPLIGLGAVYREQGRLRESERTLRQAQTILRANPALKERMADVTGELGLTLRALGDERGAQALLRESHDLLQSTFGDGHPSTRQARARLDAAGS